MPLKILSKKSWHPGRAENIARVERDEREEQAKARALRVAQAEGDLALLQQRAGLGQEELKDSPREPPRRPDQHHHHQQQQQAAGQGPAAAAAAAAAAAGVRLGEGSLEVGGAAVRSIHRYIQSGSSGGNGSGGSSSSGPAAAAARVAARDAAEKEKEDPLTAIRRRLGSGASGSAGLPQPAPAPALKRPRPADFGASGVLERLREERRLREAVEGAKASLLMRQ